MAELVDTRTVHALFAAQREAYETALRLGRESLGGHDAQHRDLADRAIADLTRQLHTTRRELDDAQNLIRRLLDHAGGHVALKDFAWNFGLCPNPSIVTLPTALGDGTVVMLRTPAGEPWPPEDPWAREAPGV